jgi:hypothetical protein
MFKPTRSRLRSLFHASVVVASMAQAFSFPVQANPPGAAHRAEKGRAGAARNAFSHEHRPNPVSPPVPGPGSQGSGWRLPRVARLAQMLMTSFILGLVASDPCAGQAYPQGGLAGLSSLPSLNLSSPDPTSMFVAQEVNLVFGKANVTGGLPPLETINELLARNSPMGISILQTLPAPEPPAPKPMAADPPAMPAPSAEPEAASLPEPGALPYPVEVPAANIAANPDAEVLAAQVSIDYGGYDAAYGFLEGIGYQLVAASELLQPNQPLAASGLAFAGNQLLSFGYLAQGFKGAEEIFVGQRALRVAQNATRSAATPAPAPASVGSNSSSTAPQGRADALARVIDPDIIYGRWIWYPSQSNTNTSMVLKLTPNALVNTTRTAGGPNGTSAVYTRNYPGSVSAEITYVAPDEDLAAPNAKSKVHVRVRVEQASGNSLEFSFVYQNASNADGKTHLDTLEQADGVFIKQQ